MGNGIMLRVNMQSGYTCMFSAAPALFIFLTGRFKILPLPGAFHLLYGRIDYYI